MQQIFTLWGSLGSASQLNRWSPAGRYGRLQAVEQKTTARNRRGLAGDRWLSCEVARRLSCEVAP